MESLLVAEIRHSISWDALSQNNWVYCSLLFFCINFVLIFWVALFGTATAKRKENFFEAIFGSLPVQVFTLIIAGSASGLTSELQRVAGLRSREEFGFAPIFAIFLVFWPLLLLIANALVALLGYILGVIIRLLFYPFRRR